MPLVFEQNIGQAPRDIRFLSRGSGFTLGLSGTETTLALRPTVPLSHPSRVASPPPVQGSSGGSPSSTQGAVTATVKTRLVGANQKAKARGEKRLRAKINYFLGNDPKKWHRDVPAYERVRTANVYPGIDVVHYGKQTGALEYDFVVAPGADPARIAFAVEGAESVRLAESGDLVIAAAGGELRQQKPVCYQEINGGRLRVEGAFELTAAFSEHRVSIRLGDYNPALPLVIDPVIEYSTHLNGNMNDDIASGVATDGAGRAYVTGKTYSTDWPIKSHLQADQANLDVFVTVLDTTATGADSLVYSTYLGSNDTDESYGIAADPTGRAFIIGKTSGQGFPLRNEYQDTSSGIFVTALDTHAAGEDSLVYSSVLPWQAWGNAIATDGTGKAFITGIAYSGELPLKGQYQVDQPFEDAFITVLDTTLAGQPSLAYSTYLGGSSGEIATAIATDGLGRAYVTGYTFSTDFPVLGQFQTDQGNADVFVTVLDTTTTGTACLVYSTYLGGSSVTAMGDQGDFATAIAADAGGRAFVTGTTFSSDFPVVGEFSSGTPRDVFVSALDTTATGAASLLYSTYLGGDFGTGIATDGAGKAYVTGYTEYADIPTVHEILDFDGPTDAFVAVLDTEATGIAALVFATYLGGDSWDYGYGIAASDNGRVYVTGATQSANFPVVGEFQSGDTSLHSFLSVLDVRIPPAPPSDVYVNGIGSTQVEVSWIDHASDEAGFLIERTEDLGGTFVTVGSVGAVDGTGGTGIFVDTSAVPETTYVYFVASVAASGAASNRVWHWPPITPLAAPTSPYAYPTTFSPTVGWISQSNQNHQYRIERRRGAEPFELAGIRGGWWAGAALEWSEVSALEEDTYTYRVTTEWWDTYSTKSDSVEVSTVFLRAPTLFQSATFSEDHIDLTWADNSQIEDGYVIERWTGWLNEGPWVQIASVGPDVTSYSDENLPAGNLCWYRIRAFKGAAFSAYSDWTWSWTSPLPDAPTDLTATAISSTEVKLNWTDNSDWETGFRIIRSRNGDPIDLIGTVGPNVVAYTDSNLIPSTSYTYWVQAFQGSDMSWFSNDAYAYTLYPLEAPFGLTATVLGSSQIKLNWSDNNADESGFKVERKSTGAFTVIGSPAADVTTFTSSGLLAQTTYTYRVRAYRGSEFSAYTDEVSAATLPLPLAPSDLNATALNSTQIKLIWIDNATDENSYRLERKSGGGAFAQVASLAANVTSYTNTGLAGNTTYTYRLRALRGNDFSSYSNEASATTTAPPVAPSDLTATVQGSKVIKLMWVDYSSDENTFRLERKAGTGAFALIATLAANVTSYNNTSLTPNTSYTYRIRALRGVDYSLYSNEANATTPPLPHAPSDLAATALNSTQVKLTWTDNSSDETKFLLERKTGGAFAQIASLNANVTSYTNTGLTPATSYTYRLRALRGSDYSDYSNEVAVTTPPLPIAPSELAATALNATQIRLTWVDNSTDETGFRLERKTGGGAFALVNTLAAGVTACNSTGLTPDTTYTFRIRAYNSNGNSAYSNEALATTLPVPQAPSSLAAIALSSTRIDLTWLDNSTDETGFRIERKIGTGAFVQIASRAAGVTTFSNTGLMPETAYTYRVRAYNANGNSAYSNEDSETTPSGGSSSLARPREQYDPKRKTPAQAKVLAFGGTALIGDRWVVAERGVAIRKRPTSRTRGGAFGFTERRKS